MSEDMKAAVLLWIFTPVLVACVGLKLAGWIRARQAKRTRAAAQPVERSDFATEARAVDPTDDAQLGAFLERWRGRVPKKAPVFRESEKTANTSEVATTSSWGPDFWRCNLKSGERTSIPTFVALPAAGRWRFTDGVDTHAWTEAKFGDRSIWNPYARPILVEVCRG